MADDGDLGKEPAFPIARNVYNDGLTKFEYLAAEAMKALISRHEFLESPECVTDQAEEYAEAMIKMFEGR